ncbi:MAG: aspartyl/glutamyl-tRNA amidotransferase subunit C [archaeon]|nr:aspartyl/glutamyl-tRNA amidotransferase subunit C [archaeon]
MDRKTVEKVARIAHLSLTEEEVDRYSLELKDILGYFEILDEAPGIDSRGFNPVEVADVFRDDVPLMEVPAEECMRGMKLYDGYVRGPKII